ncbi:MAG: phosphoglycerate dehydrogenase [Candidatus Helarchaeota archaeon]
MKKKIIIPEPLDSEAIEEFKHRNGFELKILDRPSRDVLMKEIRDASGLIVRSKTKVDKELLSIAENLEVVGRAGVGTDNIDVDFAEARGILVINAPEESLDSVADLTLGLILGICRKINLAIFRTCKGDFNRKGLVGFELQGKTLGILGFGRIGRKVARRAKAFGLKIITHDPYISGKIQRTPGVEFVSFKELLQNSDIISIHVPLNKKTKHLISHEEFALMKDGVFIINTSRGEVVNTDALFSALQSKKVAGAGLDVVEEESERCILIDHPNVIITPHIGASTFDAQKNVSWKILEGVFDVLHGREPVYPVNFPKLSEDIRQIYTPFRELIIILARLLVVLNQEAFNQIQLNFPEALPTDLIRTLSRDFLAIFLEPLVSTRINAINSMKIAEDRQIQIVESIRIGKDFEKEIKIQVKNNKKSNTQIAGMIDSLNNIHITMIDEFMLDFIPRGNIFLIHYEDMPGMIGKFSTFLGKNNINIAELQVAQNRALKTQLMMLKTDEKVSGTIIDEMKKIEGTRFLSYYEL